MSDQGEQGSVWPVLRVVLDIGANVVLPLAIYLLLRTPLGDVSALIWSALPSIVWSIVGLVRNRKVDALAVVMLVGIALSLLAFLGGGSVKALQLREKFATLAFGLAFLGSAAIGKPLIWHLARASEARKGGNAARIMDDNRDKPEMRHAMMKMTLVWGFGLVLEFASSLLLIYALPMTEYLMIGPLIGYGTITVLGVWTFRYVRKVRSARNGHDPQSRF